MGKSGYADGVITVFFSLISMLFFALFFTLIESVRYQGARMQCVNVTDMAHYSVFGEYEKKLLDDFELFGVDGSYGSGDFSIDRVRDHLAEYMKENSVPNASRLISWCFDPWQIGQGETAVTGYALLTDGDGEVFYQQAVSYMRQTGITTSAGKLLSFYRESKKAKEQQEIYEKEKIRGDQEMIQLEEQEQQKKKELEAAGDGDGASTPPEPARVENPLPALRKLAGKDLLTIVCPGGKVSEYKVVRADLASVRKKQKGTMELPARYKGLLNDLYFREYLLDHFGDYCAVNEEARLQYELEYILCGKRTDRDNLKGTVRRLLLLREGSNYLYCSKDTKMSGDAGMLAQLLIGWTGIPALSSMLKHALLLGWAYGESLLDVRTLLEGGKIPLAKSGETWLLSLENLSRINELLDEGGKDCGEGLSYHSYLRLLLNLQFTGVQKRRGMDLIELRVSHDSGLSNFRMDHMVAAMRDETEWKISPVFSRVTGVVLQAAGEPAKLVTQGGFAYE